MNNTKQPKRYVERWIDESYRDREHELVTTAEIAQMAGVDLRTVNGWRQRYEHFPRTIKETDIGAAPTRSFVAKKVAEWLIEWRPRNRDESEAHLGVFAAGLDAEIAVLRGQLRHLESVRDQVRSAIGEGESER